MEPYRIEIRSYIVEPVLTTAYGDVIFAMQWEWWRFLPVTPVPVVFFSRSRRLGRDHLSPAAWDANV